MEEERYNYIVLDSSTIYSTNYPDSWDATTNTASWIIPQYLFSEYKHNDNIYIELESCICIKESTDNTYNSCATVYVSGVNLYNQQSTSQLTILGLVPCNVFIYGTNNVVSSQGNKLDGMKLKSDRFSTISLQVYIDNVSIDMYDITKPFRFILKVSYKKKN